MSEQTVSQERGGGVKVTGLRDDPDVAAVEAAVCREVNALHIRVNNPSDKYPQVSRDSLANRDQRRPFTLSRQFTWFILYGHPYFSTLYSSTRLSTMYGWDHSTILHGLRRAEDHVALGSRDKAAVALQAALDSLAHQFGEYRVIEERVPDSIPAPVVVAASVLSANETQPISNDHKQKIRELRAAGYYPQNIAERFGLSVGTIREICNGEDRASQ